MARPSPLRAAAALLVLLACAWPREAGAQDGDGPPYVPPTERYGVAWGDAPEAVVARLGRPPDVTEPAGTLTYVGRGGGQALFLFEREHLTVVVDATPTFQSEADARAEYARLKAAIASRYGTPVLDESPRPGDPAVVDSVWEPGDGGSDGAPRAVELTLDAVGPRPFVYVRVVGPTVGD